MDWDRPNFGIGLAVVFAFLVPCGALQADPIGLTEFRPLDGTGNNLLNSSWGSANSALRRRLPAAYVDGIAAPPGGSLASAREISNMICSQSTSIPNAANVTDFFWQWGQFVDHDIALTQSHNPPELFNIAVPLGDPFFDVGGTGTQEIHLLRSRHTTGPSQRQQINQITAFLDGSGVYGSDLARSNELRRLDGSGKLKTSSGEMLPFNVNYFLNDPDRFDPTYALAGDVRANEQPALKALHTLFVREHNWQADQLAAIDPSLTGEQLFQLARAIVIAELQIITYRDWLPYLLGPGALAPYAGYDDQVDPQLMNCFSAAAFRFGHTMLSSQLLRIDSNLQPIANGHLPLMDAYFPRTLLADNGGLDPVLRGLAKQPAQEIDPFVIDDVRNFLFGPPGAGGFDLASLNVQRGRDHGLPRYASARGMLGLSTPTSFTDVTTDAGLLARLEAAYATIDDVDLWTGGLAEDKLPGALIGETFWTIIRDQFAALRDGDRFWYESYLPESLQTVLENQTLLTIIQRNTGIGSEIQDDVFVMGGTTVAVGGPDLPLVNPVRLGRPFPNPSSGNVAATLTIPFGEDFDVLVAVYDAQGRLVRSLFDGTVHGGAHLFRWDGRREDGTGVGAGVYFMRARSDAYTATRKIIMTDAP